MNLLKQVRLFVLALILLQFGSALSAVAQEVIIPASCVLFERESAREMKGLLVQLTLPGRPNFESVAAGDEPESIVALLTPQPLCWTFEFHVYHVQLFQLLISSINNASIAEAVGREVVVHGVISPAETGHHHTPLMIEVLAIDPIPAPRADANSSGCENERTQAAMNQCFALNAGEAERQMQEAFDLLLATVETERRSDVQATQTAWVSYREEQCRYEAAPFEGGTLQPSVNAKCRGGLAISRRLEIEKMLAVENR